MPTTLTLNLTKGTPITTDHPGKIAVIGQGDSLAIHLLSNWASGDGIERIDFYHDEASKNAGGNSLLNWPDGTNGLGRVFGLTTTGNPVQTLTIEHKESLATEDSWWYKVTAGGKALDPELINKVGAGGTGWVDQG